MAESRLARRHMPIGSLERLKELGLDPARYGSCAESNQKEVRGCPYWGSCLFDRPDWGGFKGTRPHNVGYFLRTHEGSRKADYIACFGFVAALQARMIDGMSSELRRERHEFIRIVGQEGSEIPVRVTVEKEPAPGQPWNSPRELVVESKKIRIPQFPDPATVDTMVEYERELEQLLAAMPEMTISAGVDLSGAVETPEDAEKESDRSKGRGGRHGNPEA